MLINLLANAVKFSVEKGEVEIKVEQGEDTLQVSVIDHGRGIPSELKQLIFERFKQADAADESQKGGTGLGLAIAKAIVERHGGTIGVESELGHGSRFWFRLPHNSSLAEAEKDKIAQA